MIYLLSAAQLVMACIFLYTQDIMYIYAYLGFSVIFAPLLFVAVLGALMNSDNKDWDGWKSKKTILHFIPLGVLKPLVSIAAVAMYPSLPSILLIIASSCGYASRSFIRVMKAEALGND